MIDPLTKNMANAWIKFVSSFRKYPTGFSEQDWLDWWPRIASACRTTQSQVLKDEGIKAIQYFNKHLGVM